MWFGGGDSGGSSVCLPISNQLYADKATSTDPAQATGSACAPFNNVTAAIGAAPTGTEILIAGGQGANYVGEGVLTPVQSDITLRGIVGGSLRPEVAGVDFASAGVGDTVIDGVDVGLDGVASSGSGRLVLRNTNIAGDVSGGAAVVVIGRNVQVGGALNAPGGLIFEEFSGWELQTNAAVLVPGINTVLITGAPGVVDDDPRVFVSQGVDGQPPEWQAWPISTSPTGAAGEISVQLMVVGTPPVDPVTVNLSVIYGGFNA